MIARNDDEPDDESCLSPRGRRALRDPDDLPEPREPGRYRVGGRTVYEEDFIYDPIGRGP